MEIKALKQIISFAQTVDKRCIFNILYLLCSSTQSPTLHLTYHILYCNVAIYDKIIHQNVQLRVFLKYVIIFIDNLSYDVVVIVDLTS